MNQPKSTWLQMSVSQACHVFISHTKFTQFANASGQLIQQYVEAVSYNNQICVIAHKAGRGTQVNDGRRFRTAFAKRVYMRHDVVANPLLLLFGILKVDILQVGFHLGQLLVAYVKTKLLLGFGQVQP